MKKLLPLIAIVLFILTCRIIPENPVDPGDDKYKAPYVVIDTISFRSGDTIADEEISIRFTGNLPEKNKFRYRFNSLDWSTWKHTDIKNEIRKSLTFGDTGLHVVEIQICYDIEGEITDTTFTFLKVNAPRIVTHPKSVEVTVGQNAEFSVIAEGTNLKYQWQKDSINIPEANLSTYSITNSKQSDSGNVFHCAVWNRFDTIVSNGAKLSVFEKVIPPIIAIQPVDITVTEKQPATFSVIATGTNLMFQWQKDTIDILGENKSTLTFTTAVLADNASKYRCIVYNSIDTVKSNFAKLFVTSDVIKPVITREPLSLSVTVAQPVEFTVTATGTNLKYQWQRDTVNISNAGSPTYKITSVAQIDSGASFRCIVSNSAGSVISKTAILSVVNTIAGPQIIKQPVGLNVEEGQPASFLVEATGTNIKYQWQKDTVNINGAVLPEYKISETTGADSGTTFRCIVSNTVGKIITDKVILSVSRKKVAPAIVSEPTDTTVLEGQSAKFTILATGSDLKYQWQKDSVDIPGENKSTLTITSVALADNATNFRCIVYNSIDTAKSNFAKLFVAATVIKPAITRDPLSLSVTVTQPAEFTVTATGTDLKYQWQKDTVNITNATFPAYKISSVTQSDSGSLFRCIVSNKVGSVTSKAAILSVVNTEIGPQILKQPVSLNVEEGQSASFLIEATGTNLKYQWQKDTVNIDGAVLPEYKISKTAVADSGTTYRCVVGNAVDTIITNKVILSVSRKKIAPVILTEPVDVSVLEEESAFFTVTASGTDNKYQWQKDTLNVENATAPTHNIVKTTLADNGSRYRCIINNSAGSVLSRNAVLTVTKKIDAPVIVTQPSDLSVTEENVATFFIVASGTNLKYQWQLDTTDIPGATDTLYTVKKAALVNNGQKFRCIVSNSAGIVISKPATLSVVQNVEPPSIIGNPTSQFVKLGQPVTFSVTATGTNIRYQWQRNEVNIDGANSPAYPISAVTSADNGSSYRCVVSNSASSATSSAAVLTVVYTVTYYGNGQSNGTVPTDLVTYPQGGVVSIVDNTGILRKDGHTFSGWNRLQSGKGKRYQPSDTLLMGSTNVSLFSEWVIDTFIITFNSNDGSAFLEQKVIWNGFVSEPALPKRAGYRFDGWFTTSSLTVAYDFSTSITAPRTLYAKWTPVFTVTYNANGAEGNVPVDNTLYLNNQTVTVLGNSGGLKKTGHSFAGWNTQADTLGQNYLETNTFNIANKNVILYAKWRANTYTVTFNSNNGSEPNPVTKVVKYGSVYGTLATTTRNGYQFGGWWSGIDGTGSQIIPTTQVTTPSNDTLYARWTAEVYTIAYVLDEGINHVDNPGNYTIESRTIELKSPTRNGYQFGGWYTDSIFTKSISQIQSGSNGNILVYAKWTPEVYTISYVLKEGTNHVDNPGNYTIESKTIEFKSPTRNGYQFSGWYTDSIFTTSISQIQSGSNRNILVYAKWTIITNTITYVLNGGKNSINNPSVYTIETNTIILDTASKIDYAFSGWYSDSLYINPVTQIKHGSIGNLNLYAKWIWKGGNVVDIDGNIYPTVQIGTQVWTTVNLRVTRFNNGDSIPLVTNNSDWSNLSTPGYCFYNHSSDTAYQKKWGALYNWYVVNPNNSKKIAPDGWRVPTDADWTTLENYLIANGYNWDKTTSGNKIAKSMATTTQTDWKTSTNAGAIGNDLSKNNVSGYSALPGGYRNGNGDFYDQTGHSGWWSATEYDASYASYRFLRFDQENLYRATHFNKQHGFSVRLLRN